MTRAQISGKDAVFEVPRRSGHLEHGIYTSELWDTGGYSRCNAPRHGAERAAPRST
ncbi:MAG TPA: hypothetical protein VM580_25420 [Labilithrix sp.]|nr:hypothetical protein [Labilithrix sp.]